MKPLKSLPLHLRNATLYLFLFSFSLRPGLFLSLCSEDHPCPLEVRSTLIEVAPTSISNLLSPHSPPLPPCFRSFFFYYLLFPYKITFVAAHGVW